MILKATLELTLGICMKLFIENGRIHYADLVNDYLFWLPGVAAKDGEGVQRLVAARVDEVERHHRRVHAALAAK